MSRDEDKPPRLGELFTAAITLHEMFISLVEAGFTEEQAMELVKAALAAGSPPS
jgi:hypothetical protein